MHERAQPVPPIFRPELAARGIFYAAHARKRGVCVGFPAVKAIWGNKAAPWLADRMLRRQGYEEQTTGQPLPERQDNLYAAPEGDPGAHGRFDDRARARSLQLLWTMHRAAIAAAAVLVAAAIAALWAWT